MAYLEGQPLSDILRQGPMDERKAAELVRTLALALEEAHRRGIVHRDLKPANVMITTFRAAGHHGLRLAVEAAAAMCA